MILPTGLPAQVNINLPQQVEECLIDPREWPFPCKDKFPTFQFVQNSGTSGTTQVMSLGFNNFHK